MKIINDYEKIVRDGVLYNSVNKLLRVELPKITKKIEQYLDDKNINLDIYCWFENHSLGIEHITTWGIELDFDDYEWSYRSGKPHYVTISMALEEIKDKDRRSILRTTNEQIKENYTLILSLGRLKNSFDSNLKPFDHIKEEQINLNNLKDEKFISYKLLEIKNWIDSVFLQFTNGIDKIEINDLEKIDE